MLKKIIHGLISIIVAFAIMLFCSYCVVLTNNVEITTIIFVAFYFATGLTMRPFYNVKHIAIPFLITTLLLLIVLVYVGWGLWYLNYPKVVLVIASFYLGLYFKITKPIYRISNAVLIILFFVTWMTYYPVIALKKNSKSFDNSNAVILTVPGSVTIMDDKKQKTDFEYKEGKVYLLEFYFKNCLPCREKEPVLDLLQETVKDTNFCIIYFDNGDIDKYEEFLETSKVYGNKNRFYDSAGLMAKLFKAESYPTEIIINKQKRMVYRTEGYSEGLNKEYLKLNVERIKTLLNE